MRLATVSSFGGVELDALLLALAQDVHERQLDVGQEVDEPALVELRGLLLGERVDEHGVGALLVLGVDGEPALLDQLVERVAAAGGIEQVGGDLGVEHEVGRDVAERLGVVGDDGAVLGGGDELGGVVARADERVAAAGVGAEAPVLLARDQLALGDLGGDGDERERVAAEHVDVGGAALADRDRSWRPAPRGAGSRPPRARTSASSRRRSGSRSSHSRNVWRRSARSGRRVTSASRSRSTGTSKTIVASCLETRASSAWLVRFSLRLAPEISSTLASTVSRSPKRWRSSAAVLSPMPGTPGMLSRGVALEADEVGDQLGRDAVALDHALAVVDLRVGNAPRGGHDPHAVVDHLVGVAVAADDHHRDAALLGLPDERGDHVVGLVALDGDVAVAERLDERAQRRPLLLEQVGARGALRLVIGGDLLAAGHPGVPHHDGRHLAVVGEDLHEHRREAEDRVGRAAVRGGDRFGQREERAVGERVPVDQEQLAGCVAVALRHRVRTLYVARGSRLGAVCRDPR